MAHSLSLVKPASLASFLKILRSTIFTYPVSQRFLDSQTANLINPRRHRVATDQVSIRLPASAVSGLKDEAVLALFTRGFFAGPVFAIERILMRAGVWRILGGFKLKATERTIWDCSKIPPAAFLPVGDVLFGAFRLMDTHVASPSDPYASYLDFGFGSNLSSFAGCHRFSLHRSRGKAAGLQELEEEIEIRLEHFRCNPTTDKDTWAEYIPWVHRWYAKLLFTDGIRSVISGWTETRKIKQ